MKKIILTDIDGIAVKWQSGLPFFLSKHNMPTDVALQMVTDEKFRDMTEIFGCNENLASILMNEYNNSSFIRYLSPYSDALTVINRMKYDYDFVAVTALGTTPTASLNRIANLNTLFPSAFKEVMVVGHGESKTHRYLEAKQKYGNRLVCFVDDLAVNLNDCHNVISQIPLFHMIRGERESPSVPHSVVNDWYEVEQNIREKYDPKPIE
ncbi:hypothetical protein POP12_249 [Pectobacterium phage POP12]|nr:hypothetical protein POP12_249 [Pectobacterium phage POP12]